MGAVVCGFEDRTARFAAARPSARNSINRVDEIHCRFKPLSRDDIRQIVTLQPRALPHWGSPGHTPGRTDEAKDWLAQLGV